MIVDRDELREELGRVDARAELNRAGTDERALAAWAVRFGRAAVDALDELADQVSRLREAGW